MMTMISGMVSLILYILRHDVSRPVLAQLVESVDPPPIADILITSRGSLATLTR